ncbi:YjgN family protein [Pseudemcibacter aquimaris]|uniref:YjgN family protein n=1 Tax=Pseudemcibacter aquimaris TaxID=2857064 RepID=UPI002010E752|nr:YjgN family protein [Pseudemcibacter aquimaris]MCC3862405.1 DUF898 domain-containing protein [Pseudemcibacter aquimaris]WDU59165.1 DUF898 domain-containing protein [Pseudemcibacter aquimaris]
MSDNPIDNNQTAENIHKINYSGSTSELMPIVLKNLFFTIITFGIYRFWAKTNLRKYYWNKTKLDDEIFIYTGTGGELFLGAVIVFFLFVIPFTILFGYVSAAYPTIAPFLPIVLYPFFIFMIGVAIYRAQVYRMSRTYWRGIRGAQTPGSMAYGWLSIKYAILYFLTLGLIAPYAICKMWNFMFDNKRFGSGSFKSDAKSKPLFKVWLMTYVAMIVIVGGIGSMLVDAFVSQNIPMIITGYLIIFVAMSVVLAWFQTAMYNTLISSVTFEGAKLNFEMDVMKYILFSLKNTLILIFTLGLGAPFVMQRWVRLFCEELSIHGQIDFSNISQSPEQGPEFGEGLVEAFDIG